MSDEIEKWITDRYGRISRSAVISDLIEVHVAAVRVYGGVAIGMGPTEQMATHDLYEDIVWTRELQTGLTGFWRKRRDEIDKAKGR